jgi:hypothetical protein
MQVAPCDFMPCGNSSSFGALGFNEGGDSYGNGAGALRNFLCSIGIHLCDYEEPAEPETHPIRDFWNSPTEPRQELLFLCYTCGPMLDTNGTPLVRKTPQTKGELIVGLASALTLKPSGSIVAKEEAAIAEVIATTRGPIKNLGGTVEEAAAKARTQPYRPDTVSRHAQERMASRGVSYKSTQEAIKNGNRTFNPATGVATYDLPAAASSTGRAVTVIRNDISGNIISVIDKGSK